MENGILFIDNDQILLKIYRKFFRKEYDRVDTAETGIEALRLLQSNQYRIIITDLYLSKNREDNSFEIVKFIRQNQPESKIIMLTTDIEFGMQELESIESLVDKICEKPVPLKILRKTIRNLRF